MSSRQSKTLILIILILNSFIYSCNQNYSAEGTIQVTGEVNNSINLSLADFKKMDAFHVANVTLLKEKSQTGTEEQIGVHHYKGVLIRDILEKAGMKYVRKFEPGIYVKVIGSDGREVVFSFGEIFYSSIGRSILIAYEKDYKNISVGKGLGELIVATDLRSGRQIKGVREIHVNRVEIPMKVYEDRKKKITRPPTSEFIIEDKKTGKFIALGLNDLEKMEVLNVRDVILTGDCEGFNGVHTFKGTTLRALLEKLDIEPYHNAYDRFVVISSENGFSATFSIGEIFNSRLSDNIVIAYKKNGILLEAKEAFAMSAVREDSLGGRSVRRISRIDVY